MLLGSALSPNPKARLAARTLEIKGEPSSPINPPPGCRFKSRCPFAFDRCRTEEPPLQEIEPAHAAACHLSITELVAKADRPMPIAPMKSTMRGEIPHV
jgi:oligopeptide/dipeptide ABC transporter ATP-binding protein